MGKSKLQIAQQKAQDAIKRTNAKIEELGNNTKELYKALTRIQNTFEKIRDIPADEILKYEECKNTRLTWKEKAEKIKNDYDNAFKRCIGGGIGGGVLGIGITVLGPTAAMGIATTFGVASTGTAISALSGAAATNAALAWLGGGALVAGDGGMAAGNAFLTLAGPIGWSIAGISITISGILFLINRKNKQKLENLFTLISERDVKKYDLACVEINERIKRIINEIPKLETAAEEIETYGNNYASMTEQQQYTLGAYFNLMLASTQLLVSPILGLQPVYTTTNFDNFVYKSFQYPDSLEIKDYNKVQQNAIIALANLLYSIDIDDKDEKLLFKSLRKNKDFLKSSGLDKEHFIQQIVHYARIVAKEFP